MSFLTTHMEAMLAAATDPEEIKLRRKVLDDHLAMQEELAARTQPPELIGQSTVVQD